jgi:hypothetical protein
MPLSMNLTERLTKICEEIFPMPPKCCGGTKRDINDARLYRLFRYKKILAGLDKEGQEKQVKEWEEKYLING